MPKVDWRLLLIVACAFIVAASAVTIAKPKEGTGSPSSLVEVIPPKGAAMSDMTLDGMQLEVSANGLTLTLAECNSDKFQDRFFLHLYTKAGPQRASEPYVNLDFSLAQLTPKEVPAKAGKACVYFKSFSDFSVQQLNLGQFTTPGGRCCEITWSRSYLFDKGPKARQ